MTISLAQTAQRAAQHEDESRRRYQLVTEGLDVAKTLSDALKQDEYKIRQLENMLAIAKRENQQLRNVVQQVDAHLQNSHNKGYEQSAWVMHSPPPTPHNNVQTKIVEGR